jgi:hypothetical protein
MVWEDILIFPLDWNKKVRSAIMAISNFLFSPTLENPHGFPSWFCTYKVVLNRRLLQEIKKIIKLKKVPLDVLFDSATFGSK